MCKLVPILRVIGFVFLVLAILTCVLGFIAPFWIRIPTEDQLETPGVEPTTEATLNRDGSPFPVGGGSPQQSLATTEKETVSPILDITGTTVESTGQGFVDSISSYLLQHGTYWGLWATCHNNLTCKWFCENNFEMEREFKDWHKAVQGLFGLGLIVLLIALKTASFHVCCCHCCRDSYAISTVIGSLTAAGLILVTVALLVYAGFAAVTFSIEVTGPRVFEWAFFVPVGGVALALIAAILFLVDGHRGPSDNDADGEETAKMV